MHGTATYLSSSKVAGTKPYRVRERSFGDNPSLAILRLATPIAHRKGSVSNFAMEW